MKLTPPPCITYNEFGVTPRLGRSEVLFSRHRRSPARWVLLIALVCAVAGFIFAASAGAQTTGYSLDITLLEVHEGDIILICVDHEITRTEQAKGATPPSVRLTTRPAETGGAIPGKDYATGPFTTRHNPAKGQSDTNQCACIPTIRDLEEEEHYKEFYITIDPSTVPEGAELSQVRHEARISILDVTYGDHNPPEVGRLRYQDSGGSLDREEMKAFCENTATPVPPAPPPPAPPTTTTPRPPVTPQPPPSPEPEPETETETETEMETEPEPMGEDMDEAEEATEVSEGDGGGCAMASAGAERGVFQFALAVFALGAAVLGSGRFRRR